MNLNIPTSFYRQRKIVMLYCACVLDKLKMASALRFGAVLRRGLCPSVVVARRGYSNGADRIPLTFASPTQVRKGANKDLLFNWALIRNILHADCMFFS